MWDLETERVIDEIKNRNARLVLFQAPEGLKRAVEQEIEKIKKQVSAELVIWGETCFGACDLCDEEIKMLGADLVVHYGHEPLPYVNPSIPTVFVHAYYSKEDENIVKNVEEILKDMDGEVIVATTIQFKKALEKFNPVVILGCRANIENANVDNVLFVGTGRFHPLMIAYKLKKSVKIYNPLTGAVSQITDEEIKKLIKKRIGKVSKLLIDPPKKVGVILSTKKGQCRIRIFEKVVELLRENDINYIPIVLNNISPQYLIYKVDAYVVCACPRIVMDDYSLYDKPLITPKELEMFINKDFDYVCDEILEWDF